jgi:hypothetical protein
MRWWLWRLLILLILAPLAILVVKSCTSDERTRAMSEARTKGVLELAGAGSLDELKTAVGWLGTVIVLPNREWVAIYYEDSHGSPAWSQAVVLDSGGNWYESQTHFCGGLNLLSREPDIIRKSLADRKAGRPDSSPPGPNESLFISFHLICILEAANLESASEHLSALGFIRMQVTEVPRLRGRLPAE